MRSSGRRGRSARSGRVSSAGVGTGELDLFGAAGDDSSPVAPESRQRPAAPAAESASPRRSRAVGDGPTAAIPVSVLVRIAKDVLEGAFVPLWVRGEVSDFKAHRNGHWYFCLRDETSQVRCVVWSRDQDRIPAPPDDGMQVAARGHLTVYPARGEMQFTVGQLEAVGDGLWRKALEMAYGRLLADGLLAPERKRALPRLPRRVAVVTSVDGAALRDIIAVARRRCPIVEIIAVATRVQGDNAPAEIAAAVERVGRWGSADCLIVGRGGGAREDLWAFNDERVARAVAAAPMPTISAVGHEVDVTLCDLVADVRAPTPSAAAEACVPVLQDLGAELALAAGLLGTAMARRLAAGRRNVAEHAGTLAALVGRHIERRRARLDVLSGRLDALSPLAVLARGYSVARGADGQALARVAALPPGTSFELLVQDGSVRAVVTGQSEGEKDRHPPHGRRAGVALQPAAGPAQCGSGDAEQCAPGRTRSNGR